MVYYKYSLQGLNYPDAEKFDINDQQLYRTLVLWIENQKLRSYELEERKGISDLQSPEWEKAFQKYLDDLKCHIELKPANKQKVLEWLLQQALFAESEDHGDELSSLPQLQTAQISQVPFSPFEDAGTDGFQQQLNALFKELHLDTLSKQDQVAALQKALELIDDQIYPTIAQNTKYTNKEDLLKQIPVGFETGDYTTDLAARLLRLGFIKDIRKLQSQVDDLTVKLQDYTANPQTDNTLGKIGR